MTRETAIRSAFQNLLAETGKLHKWTQIPGLAMKAEGKSIRPDGTMRDGLWFFPRGFWEANDTGDDLAEEITRKIAVGYPTLSTIFEDTRTGVLYQNGRRVLQADLREPAQLVGLLNQFHARTERDVEGFEQAVIDFRDRIPALAKGAAREGPGGPSGQHDVRGCVRLPPRHLPEFAEPQDHGPHHRRHACPAPPDERPFEGVSND